MTENDNHHSGSRWEPQGTPAAGAPDWRSETRPVEPAAVAARAAEPAPAAVPSGGPAGARSAGRKGRVALAGGALGLLLAGGIGGFAIGNAGAGTTTGTSQTGVVQPGQAGTGEFPGDGGGFHDGARPDFGTGTPPDLDGDDGTGTAPDGTGGTTDDGTTSGDATT